MSRLISTIVILTLLAPGAAFAQTCVSTFAGLRAALDAFDSGQSMIIALEQGTYDVDELNGHILGDFGQDGLGPSASIALYGGYRKGSNCTTGRVVDATNTVIDGHFKSYLGLSANGSIIVEGITITQMKAPDPNVFLWGSVAFLHGIEQASDDYLVFDHVRVVHNETGLVLDATGAGKIAFSGYGATSATLKLTNTLIADNATQPTITFGDDGVILLASNTVARNTGPLLLEARIATYGENTIINIDNNIFWNNGAFDLDVSGVPASSLPGATYNVIGNLKGTIKPPPPATPADPNPSNHNSSQDPIFVNDINIDVTKRDYHLHHASATPSAGDSPAINAGTAKVSDGISYTDIEGNDRIVGSAPDIGAYESPVDDQHRYKVTTAVDNGSNASPTVNSLRWALKSAYDVAHNPAVGGGSYIVFDLGCGTPIILAAGGDPLPVIDFDLTVDGTTNPGYSPNTSFTGFDATLCVQVYGGNGYARALDVTGAGKLLVRGLTLFGFSDVAIRLQGTGTHNIWGNALLNNHDGLRINGASGPAYVGGSNASMRNLISGNTGVGVLLGSDAGGSKVSHNLIGLQVDGQTAYPNGAGVKVLNSPKNTLTNNTISASTGVGVTLTGTPAVNNIIQSNRIGYNEADAPQVNSGAEAILVTNGAGYNTIGAGYFGSTGSNAIASAATGVWVDSTAGIGNSVLANIIVADQAGGAQISIDLGPSNATANGFYGGGVSNNYKYHPTIKQAFRTVGTPAYDWVEIAIDDVLHLATERVDLYASSDATTPTGRGNTAYYLGNVFISTDANGHADFWVKFPAAPVSLNQFTATATNSIGDTSENGESGQEITNDMIFRDNYEENVFQFTGNW
jgi:parallel beta-helix repeat protein